MSPPTRMGDTATLDLDRLGLSGSLPNLPTVALEVLRLCQDPDTNVEKLASTIARDPALAAKLIQTANSSFYSRGREVTSLQRAALLLGLRALKILALGFSLVHDLTQQRTASGLDLRTFWHRSAVNAVIARALSRRIGSPWCEEAFLAGLVAYIGKLALAQGMPERYTRVVRAGEGWPTEAVEREQLGFTSSEVGEALLRRWGVPESIVVGASYGERLDELDEGADPDGRALAELTGLALEATALLFADERGERLARFGVNAERLYGLGREDIDRLAQTLTAEIRETAEILALELPPEVSYQALIDEARMQIASVSLDAVMDLEQTAREADELARENAALAARALTDPLTELPNRAALEDFLSRQVQQRLRGHVPGALGVLMVDVDHFKRINDTYGHPTGDQVLRAVAAAMLAVTRGNELLARYGGEEFCVVLPQVDADGLGTAGERLRAAIARLVVDVGEHGRIPVTASVGGCCLGQVESTSAVQRLIELADRALYRAKQRGRNRVEIERAAAAAAA